MSLFDAIKYPINIPPQAGELEALPHKLFVEWIDKHTIDWNSIDADARYDAANVAHWMRRAFSHGSNNTINEINSDIAALRKLIQGWDA